MLCSNCLFVYTWFSFPSFSPQMFSPLHTAAASGQISVVRLLLELGVEVDAVNVHGNSALHIACLNGQDVVVSKLLEYQATVNSINNKGMVLLPDPDSNLTTKLEMLITATSSF